MKVHLRHGHALRDHLALDARERLDAPVDLLPVRRPHRLDRHDVQAQRGHRFARHLDGRAASPVAHAALMRDEERVLDKREDKGKGGAGAQLRRREGGGGPRGLHASARVLACLFAGGWAS